MQRGWVVSPDYRSIIETIKAVRTDLGISQRELARRLGKPPSFVNKTELFERRLDVLEFIAIAQAMQIEPDKLIARLTDNLPKPVKL